jgi:hypothetical protein
MNCINRANAIFAQPESATGAWRAKASRPYLFRHRSEFRLLFLQQT